MPPSHSTAIKSHFDVSMFVPGVLGLAGLLIFCLTAGKISPSQLQERSFEETAIEGEAFPKRLVDPSGEVQIIPSPPQRIVSAILAGDEILTALVSPDRLTAVTYLAGDPKFSNCAGLVPKSAARIHAEIESIISLQPDLVILAGYTRAETIRLLASANIPVLRFGKYGSFMDIEQNIRTIASAVGAQSEAEKIVAGMNQRIANVEKRVAGLERSRVLYFSSDGYSSGKNTLIDEMIERAGGSNVMRHLNLKGPAFITTEMAIGLNPDVILFAQWDPDSKNVSVQGLLEDPVWQHVAAVKNKRVFQVRGAWLTCVSQFAVNGLEETARWLHPEADKE